MNRIEHFQNASHVGNFHGMEILTQEEMIEADGGFLFLIPVAIALLEGVAIGVTITGGLYGVYVATR